METTSNGQGVERSQQAEVKTVKIDKTVHFDLYCYLRRLQNAVDRDPKRFPFYLRHQISLGEAIAYLLDQQSNRRTRSRRCRKHSRARKRTADAPVAESNGSSASGRTPDERIAVVEPRTAEHSP